MTTMVATVVEKEIASPLLPLGQSEAVSTRQERWCAFLRGHSPSQFLKGISIYAPSLEKLQIMTFDILFAIIQV